MLIRTLTVTLLSGIFCLQLALAEEVPPPAATEPVPAAVVSTPDAPVPPAAMTTPDEPVPPAAMTTSDEPAPPAAMTTPDEPAPQAMPPAGMPSENMEQEMEQRIKAYRELYDERKLETLKQLEQARRRFEARERAYAEKVENYPKQREDD